MRTIKIAIVTAAALAGIIAPITATAVAAASDSTTPAVVLADGTQGDDTPWG